MASRNSLNVFKWWHFQSISGVRFIEQLLFIENVLQRIRDIGVQFFNELLLLLVLIDAFLHVTVGLVDDAAVQFQLHLLAFELSLLHLDLLWVEV